MIDSYYTSPYLASKLVNYAKLFSFNSVADFCIGDGELVKAAVNIWPKIHCYGTDISEQAIKRVKNVHPNWNLGKCDFLNEKSRKKSRVINSVKQGFELIVLNPPFSCKGGTIYEVNLDEKIFKVSTSMKFLAESLKYLSKNGCLLAIMPISICYSQKDRKLWNYLTDYYKLSVLEIPNGNFFKNCNPSIVLVSINRLEKSELREINTSYSCGLSGYQIFRGKISVHDAVFNYDGIPFVHTTNLFNNSINANGRNVLNNTSIVQGPAVLVPRVGKPDNKKVCVIPCKMKFAISDCIFAIKTKNVCQSEIIYWKILENWKLFQELYRGTGAKFITMERVNCFLGETGTERNIDYYNRSLGKTRKNDQKALQINFSKECSDGLLAITGT